MNHANELVHGVFWDQPQNPRAALRVQDAAGGFRDVGLDAGTRLGFRISVPGKHCLGHHRVHGPAERDHIPCPRNAHAERGNQCGPCFGADESRLIHDFHRGGRVPIGLRAYLMQPHWLYVATFAHGATKVGTASALRKWHRLAEQGAVAARYIARADDGRIVRLLEDLVTRDAGLPQQVRSAAKAAGLADPRPAAEIEARNAEAAQRARALLAVAGGGGYEAVDERWTRPALADLACGRSPRHPHPHPLVADAHGFTIRSLSGGIALAGLTDNGPEFVVNLGDLKGRRLETGEHRSEVPAVQEPLF